MSKKVKPTGAAYFIFLISLPESAAVSKCKKKEHNYSIALWTACENIAPHYNFLISKLAQNFKTLHFRHQFTCLYFIVV